MFATAKLSQNATSYIFAETIFFNRRSSVTRWDSRLALLRCIYCFSVSIRYRYDIYKISRYRY